MPDLFIKRAIIFMLVLILTFSALGSTPARAAGICYVNLSATGANDGSTWSNAYPDLQTALTNAAACTEIWVARGTYRPSQPAGRAATFLLVTGVPLYGGFTGTETARDQRNWKTNLTILSGDLDQNDSQNPITNLLTVTGNTTNSYHVVIGVNGAILDGFTITGGYADGTTPNDSGAGMYNDTLNTALANLTFSGNLAKMTGGGIFNHGNLTLTDSTISGNSANYEGGGIVDFGGTTGRPTIANSTISGNSAYSGGGIYSSSRLTITNSTISGNSAKIGGGISGGGVQLTLTNSTLSGNSSSLNRGGGLYSYGGTLSYTNTILANSTGGDCRVVYFTTILKNDNNLVEDGSCNSYNVSNFKTGDPVLGPLAENGGPTQTLALLPGSPAIDAGAAATCAASPISGKDQRGVTRPQGAGCDIGAYESGANILTVASTNPSANATLASLSSLVVTFSENAVSDGSASAANNISNYLLVERGENGAFETASCSVGLAGDDVAQTIASAAYNSSGFTATLSLAQPLSNGKYRLFICGTTSIWSGAGLELNNGASDTVIDFFLQPETDNNAPDELPATGFPVGHITRLPAQPAEKAYSQSSLWLEIPSQGVKMEIVGVPQVAGNWDVSWLGSQAGWLQGSAFPTWQGNSVLTGHVWNADNTPGIFADLKTLRYGDKILIHAFGQTYTYEVRESKRVGVSSVSAVMKHEELAWLTLLTCEDYRVFWSTYSGRRMVRAVLISIE